MAGAVPSCRVVTLVPVAATARCCPHAQWSSACARSLSLSLSFFHVRACVRARVWLLVRVPVRVSGLCARATKGTRGEAEGSADAAGRSVRGPAVGGCKAGGLAGGRQQSRRARGSECDAVCGATSVSFIQCTHGRAQRHCGQVCDWRYGCAACTADSARLAGAEAS